MEYTSREAVLDSAKKCVWGSGKKQVGECGFDVHDGYFKALWYFDVKAWMPLPKPYKGE